MNEDTKCMVLAQLVPGAASLVGVGALLYDDDIVPWWNGLRKPDWAPKDMNAFMVMDTLTVLPFGYGAYLVHKSGGFGDSKARTALLLYGLAGCSMACSAPAAVTRSLRGMSLCTLCTAAVASAAAYAFHRVDPAAGRMALPFALWAWFYVMWTRSVTELND